MQRDESCDGDEPPMPHGYERGGSERGFRICPCILLHELLVVPHLVYRCKRRLHRPRGAPGVAQNVVEDGP